MRLGIARTRWAPDSSRRAMQHLENSVCGGERRLVATKIQRKKGAGICIKKAMLFMTNALREIVAQAVANDVELGLGHGGQRA